ncbi:MAG: hypothetical protein A2045_13790 [Rhodocyclales bacterium GWA2_65_20]|nr:MAG: hypothetical protein A2045_13790 [Rhodocyclales bacterium GWA2_65_20]
MHHISIKARLALLVGFLSVLMLGGGAVGIGGIAATNEALESTFRDRLEPTVLISKIMLLMQDNRAQVMLGIQHDPGNPFAKLHDHAPSLHADNFVRNRDAITALWDDYKKRQLSPKEKELAEKFAAARARYVGEGLAPAMEALTAGQYLKANELLLTRINPLHKEVNAAADELFKTTVDGARADYEKSQGRYQLLSVVAIGGTVLGILLAVAAGYLIIRSITGPLESVIAAFEHIAQGRLNAAIPAGGGNEMGRCLTALTSMQQQLRDTIGQIGHASGAIEGQSIQLQSSIEQVVIRSDQQLDRVQEVAATMEEVSQSVSAVAGSAESTAGAAIESQNTVRDSHQQMLDSMGATGRVVHAVETASGTIGELSDAIQRIDQITRVIKEIADQTNLLALNAAIEAARAGEQGRGFAVVADEVRKLAERTSSSTTDISRTVGEIQNVAQSAVDSMGQAVREVEESIGLMRTSGETIEKVATTSNQVTGMTQHIAAAAQQQSVATHEVARNMEQLSGLIGENHQSARDASRATADMYRAAQDLRTLVGRFAL